MRALKHHRPIIYYPLIVLTLLLLAGLLPACGFFTGTKEASLRTWLLVRPPDGPLVLHQPVTVRSRTEDANNKVSHVELYAVELPTGERNVLLRSDAAPFDQTSYTAAQVFIPNAPGHYVIKVVGFNRLGQKAESDYIGFDVQ
jgi:hypothetical protein